MEEIIICKCSCLLKNKRKNKSLLTALGMLFNAEVHSLFMFMNAVNSVTGKESSHLKRRTSFFLKLSQTTYYTLFLRLSPSTFSLFPIHHFLDLSTSLPKRDGKTERVLQERDGIGMLKQNENSLV